MRIATLAAFVSSLAACGGLIAPDPDGGAATDASMKGDATGTPSPDAGVPSPPVQCSPHSNSGYASSNGGCGTQSDWSCGADTFSIVCACPDAKCQCLKGGVLQATVPFPGCPSCGSVSPSALCNFPE